MSLIVARKEAGAIKLVSDTKLSIKNEEKESGDRQKSSPTAGVIKITIVRSTVCVAFAGGEDFAEEAMLSIPENCGIQDILSILLDTHLRSQDVTDFIVAAVIDCPRLFEIKKGQCREVESTWIGSQRAYSLFQEVFLKEGKAATTSNFSIEPVAEETKTSTFSKMSSALDKVIDSESIHEVGGFRVDAVFTKGRFQYAGYAHTYLSNQTITIKMPAGVNSVTIPFTHGTAANGGYSINFFYSENSNYVGLHILQGNFGIVYARTDGGLLRPIIVPNMDEVDFIDYAEYNYNIKPIVTIQDRSRKCIEAGDALAAQHDFEGALMWYDKALRHCYGKDRANFYYRKAVTLANLQRYSEVLPLLQKAISCDGNFSKPAAELVAGIQRRHAPKRR